MCHQADSNLGMACLKEAMICTEVTLCPWPSQPNNFDYFQILRLDGYQS